MKKNQKITAKKVFSFLFFSLPILYICIQVIFVLQRSYKVEIAIQDILENQQTYQGIIGVQEVDIPNSHQGEIHYTVKNGQRVSPEDIIANVYQDTKAYAQGMLFEALNQEINVLNASKISNINPVDLEQVSDDQKKALFVLMQAVQNGDVSQMQTIYQNLQIALNKQALEFSGKNDFEQTKNELQAQRDAAKEAANVIQIAAGQSGYFVSAQDSQKKLYTLQQLEEMSPQDLQKAAAAAPQKNDSQIAGKIWTDYRWKLFLSVPQEELERFEHIKKVNISFDADAKERIPAVVEEIVKAEPGQNGKVVLTSEYINEDVIRLEQASVKVIFSEHKGLRISSRALRVQEGKTGLYVKKGNLVHWKPVEVIYKNEQYVLISQEYEKGKNEVQHYDEIVVDGPNLYDEKIIS